MKMMWKCFEGQRHLRRIVRILNTGLRANILKHTTHGLKKQQHIHIKNKVGQKVYIILFSVLQTNDWDFRQINWETPAGVGCRTWLVLSLTPLHWLVGTLLRLCYDVTARGSRGSWRGGGETQKLEDWGWRLSYPRAAALASSEGPCRGPEASLLQNPHLAPVSTLPSNQVRNASGFCFFVFSKKKMDNASRHFLTLRQNNTLIPRTAGVAALYLDRKTICKKKQICDSPDPSLCWPL